MRIISVLLSIFLIASPAWATDVVMGAGANLVFEPAEITINAGDTVRFVNEALPPHNVIFKEVSALSHEELAFAAGDSFEITFPDPGDYNYVCGPHEGAGMTGTVHVK
jgi:plastocyanin|tara:strand:- start:3439 stop:3762 length:324 start_codon:yes stop_codon:yes gene_type:complete